MEGQLHAPDTETGGGGDRPATRLLKPTRRACPCAHPGEGGAGAPGAGAAGPPGTAQAGVTPPCPAPARPLPRSCLSRRAWERESRTRPAPRVTELPPSLPPLLRGPWDRLFLASVCESPTFILPAPGCWSTTQQRFYFSSCTFQFSKLVFLIFLLAYWSKPKFCYNNNKKKLTTLPICQ